VLEQFLMTVASTGDSSTAITALVTAIATIVASVGGILAVMLPKIKTNSVETEKAKELAIEGARAATFAARGIIENREQIKEGIEAGLELGPEELRAYAANNKDRLVEYTKQLELKRKQFERLLAMIPTEGQIDLVDKFPR
jgi:hypothetical protein